MHFMGVYQPTTGTDLLPPAPLGPRASHVLGLHVCIALEGNSGVECYPRVMTDSLLLKMAQLECFFSTARGDFSELYVIVM